MLTEAHLHIGQRIAVHLNGRTSRLRIVGDILDQTGDDLLLRGDWATLKQLDPSARLDNYEIGLNPGAPPDTVAARVSQRLAPNGPNAFGIDIRGGGDSSFVLLNGVIAGLALILISIALAGVFNTVLLTTREKAHDVAVLKAVGMAPPQVVAMMVTLVAILGVFAGALGVPAGLDIHRQVIQLMGQAASGTHIPQPHRLWLPGSTGTLGRVDRRAWGVGAGSVGRFEWRGRGTSVRIREVYEREEGPG